MNRTLLIVPAYNEEDALPAVLTDLRQHAPNADIVVIDDASRDGTADVATRAGVRCLRLPFNLGIGGAVQTGFIYAHRGGYDFAVQVDGDGQHDGEDLQRLMDPVVSGRADVSIGSRFLTGDGFRSTRLRRAGIRLFQLMTRLTARAAVSDPTSGFRAYGRDAIALLARSYPSDYPEVEALTLLARNGLRIAEVAVTMRARQGGRSSITGPRPLYYLVKVTLASLITAIKPPRPRRP